MNTALGILYLKRGRFAEALELLEAATARAGAQYTRSRDGESLYYSGVAREYLGEYETAEKAFYRASWSDAWYSRSFAALARLARISASWERLSIGGSAFPRKVLIADRADVIALAASR